MGFPSMEEKLIGRRKYVVIVGLENLETMPSTTPLIWSGPQNNENDCYFCMTKTQGFTK